MTPKQKWLLAGIILLAIGFRFYQIKTMPGGLFPDEAANGLDINLMEQGHLQPFYERGNGREALFFYMEWASVAAFGKGPWQHHIVSATVGVVGVLGCFLVTQKLFTLFGKKREEDDADPSGALAVKSRATNLALLASFFMAVSSWHVVLSRTAFRANLIPMFAGFTFYFGLLAFSAPTRAKRYMWSIITGATFALGFYSYIAYRIMAPLIVVALLWPIAVDLFKTPRFAQIKKFFGPFVALCVAFIIFIAPIAYYFWTHAGSFIGRSGQVSVFNPELNQGNLIGTIIEVFKQSMLAYFYHGDLNWRHNISGQPFLSIIISPFFAIGLIGITALAARYAFTPIKNKADWKYFLLAGWFWAMLIPVVTTAEGIPHGLRSVGAIPEVFIITAVGLVWVLGLSGKVVKKFWPMLNPWQKQVLNFAFGLKTVAFILALILQTYFLYFIYAANSPENFYAFRSDLTPVSEYLKQTGSKTNTYLILDKFSIQTVDYITAVDGAHPDNPKNQPYQQVDPENSWELQNLKRGDRIVFTQSSIFDIKKFKQFHANAKLTLEQRNKFNQTVMAVYTIQ
ncbi:MAG TPA: hypothetical protein VHQ41_00430 [Patescibacteria group bacterium]|jgi:hypothetical protein|nr:hypothetical protein [Patescibacteria group bacterium]